MAQRPLPSPEVLRQLLRYEPETGNLFWRPRGPEWFTDGAQKATHACARWNARYADTQAFVTMHNRGYLQGSIFGVVYLAHRIIWTMQMGAPPEREIDHKDLDHSNNRWCNIREATRSENNQNRRSLEGSSSKYLGVFWHKDAGKWMATIKTKGQAHYLGLFTSEVEAAQAYDAAARLHHGEFARPNFLPPQPLQLNG